MQRLLLDPVAFWTLLGTYEGEPITFDPWQIDYLHDHTRYRALEKAPQIGWSWVCALEALHEAIMFTDATSGFVSVNQSEAAEKVLYARKAYSELPRLLHEWVPIAKDSVDEFWLGDAHRPSRILSIPATSALRGRRMSVYLDEVDFYKDGGRDAFRVAMGRVARGGRVSLGSTCFGEATQLDLVMSRAAEVEGVGNFSIARLPWSVVVNPDVLAAMHVAMAELDPLDAAEEYELQRGGARADTFSADLIRQASHDLQVFDGSTEQLRDTWSPAGPAIIGYDVGKSLHPSVASGIEAYGDRWVQTLMHVPVDDRGNAMSLPEQHRLLRDLLMRLPMLAVAVDAGGIGAHTADALVGEFGEARVVVVQTNKKVPGRPPQTRLEMTTEVKRALEAGDLLLAPDREQAKQFRATRTSAAGTVEQAGSRKRSHYDRYWATAYAWYGTLCTKAVTSRYETADLYVIGGDDGRSRLASQTA